MQKVLYLLICLAVLNTTLAMADPTPDKQQQQEGVKKGDLPAADEDC